MKRQNEFDRLISKTENSEQVAVSPSEVEEPSKGVGCDHSAWDILIRKLDFQSQLKISQQNQRLAKVVNINAQSELRKFQRHIREDKYM